MITSMPQYYVVPEFGTILCGKDKSVWSVIFHLSNLYNKSMCKVCYCYGVACVLYRN